MKNKKFIKLMLIAASTMLLIAGCGSTNKESSNSNQTVTETETEKETNEYGDVKVSKKERENFIKSTAKNTMGLDGEEITFEEALGKDKLCNYVEKYKTIIHKAADGRYDVSGAPLDTDKGHIMSMYTPMIVANAMAIDEFGAVESMPGQTLIDTETGETSSVNDLKENAGIIDEEMANNFDYVGSITKNKYKIKIMYAMLKEDSALDSASLSNEMGNFLKEEYKDRFDDIGVACDGKYISIVLNDTSNNYDIEAEFYAKICIDIMKTLQDNFY